MEPMTIFFCIMTLSRELTNHSGLVWSGLVWSGNLLLAFANLSRWSSLHNFQVD
jgi:hypothetical protein